MKKTLLAIFLICIGSFSFADIIVQQDAVAAGGTVTFRRDCFNEVNPMSVHTDCDTFYGISGSILWEFDSRNQETPLHFFAGMNTGLVWYGIPFAVETGLTLDLAEGRFVSVKMNASARTGVMYGIKGGEYLFVQPSVDCIAMFRYNPMIYAGLGLTNLNILEVNCYRGYGISGTWSSSANLHLVAGIRIPIRF